MNVSLERINEDYLFEVTNSNGMSIRLDNKGKTTGVASSSETSSPSIRISSNLG